jgi:hypothetical protein
MPLVNLQELYVSVIERNALNIYDTSCMEVQYICCCQVVLFMMGG